MADAGTAVTVTIGGTTTQGTSSPAITSTTHGPGNFIIITGGTGCTVQTVEILSQASGTATFDKALGTAASTCTGVLGGGKLTIGAANTLAVSGNTINIKLGTYTLTSSIAIGVSTLSIVGYNSTWGDNPTGSSRPTVTTATNSTQLFNTGASNNGTQLFANMIWANTATTSSSGIWQQTGHGTVQWWIFSNMKMTGFLKAIDSSNSAGDDVCCITVGNSEIASTKSGSYGLYANSAVVNIYGCYFHDNSVDFINDGGGGVVTRNIFSGATSNAIILAGSPTYIKENSFYNPAAGIATSTSTSLYLDNNIFYNTVSHPWLNISMDNNHLKASILSAHNNAFGNTTVGGGTWSGSTGDIALTANPFTNTAGGDFSLNSTAGGGALLKQAGYPGSFPGATTTGYLDVGAVQSKGSGGGQVGYASVQ